MARAVSIAPLFVLALVGVSACSPIPHAWQHRPGKDVAVPIAEWTSLPRAYHCRVDARSREKATARLEERAFIAVTPEDVSAYCADFEPPADRVVSPYLVRGVAHPWPAYSVVRFDASTGRCVVYQATWDGENLLDVWASREVRPSPVVVFLPREPVEVLPVAEMGGDWILDTKGLAEEQEYARSLCWEDTDFVLRIAAGGSDDLTPIRPPSSRGRSAPVTGAGEPRRVRSGAARDSESSD
jgi:hypothetical protein